RRASWFHGNRGMTPILAYLDPGTGSIILQALLGVVFGALLGLKLFWVNIKNMTTRILRRGDRGDHDGE
ncbi:MAG: hypothetical protein ACE5EX_08160, partial [Phycisphaerae bacterium]